MNEKEKLDFVSIINVLLPLFLESGLKYNSYYYLLFFLLVSFTFGLQFTYNS